MITIKPLKKADPAVAREINGLLRQMRNNPADHKPLTLRALNKVLADPRVLVMVIRDGERIVGTGTLMLNEILTDTFAFAEDIVVRDDYRGRGLGKELVRALIVSARARGMKTVALTSRPSRVVANKLYPKLGFKLKKTNYYELDL